jgi:hypothetical protein
MALILAIGFLAVLSILGAVVLSVSTRELKSSGSFLPGKRAFYAADRAVEYSMNRDIILSLSPTETIDLVNNVRRDNAGNVLGATTYDNKVVIDSSGGGTLSSGTVSDLGPNELPPSVAELFGSDYGSNFYHVEVEAQAPGNREAKVNASIVRLFKSDDDTIFITTGVK